MNHLNCQLELNRVPLLPSLFLSHRPRPTFNFRLRFMAGAVKMSDFIFEGGEGKICLHITLTHSHTHTHTHTHTHIIHKYAQTRTYTRTQNSWHKHQSSQTNTDRLYCNIQLAEPKDLKRISEGGHDDSHLFCRWFFFIYPCVLFCVFIDYWWVRLLLRQAWMNVLLNKWKVKDSGAVASIRLQIHLIKNCKKSRIPLVLGKKSTSLI